MKTSNADKWRLQGHEGPVMGMACDASGGLLATSGADGKVRVWDVDGGFCTHHFEGHKGVVTSIMFHPDPNRLQVVNLCYLHDYRCLITIPTLESVETAKKRSDVPSINFITVGERGLLRIWSSDRLWDCENKACVGVGIGHMGAVGAVALSKKQHNFFVSGSSDCTLKVWNMDGVSGNNEEIITLKAKAVVAPHDKDINSLAVAPNDSLIWAISDGSCLRTFKGHRASVLRASFLTRGTQLVSCDMTVSPDSDGFIKLWTVRNEECIATFDQHDDKIWALALGKKTEMLATGSGDAVINLWHDSTASDKEEANFRKDVSVKVYVHSTFLAPHYTRRKVFYGVKSSKNALIDADYTRAIQIAFELRRPHGLLDIFTELHRKRDAGDQIVKAVDALSKEELRLLLEYIREWNTKTQFCHTENFVLSCIPITKMIEVLLAFKNALVDSLNYIVEKIRVCINLIPTSEVERLFPIKKNHFAKVTGSSLGNSLWQKCKIKGNEGVLEDNEQHHQDIQVKKSSEKRKSDISGDITGTLVIEYTTKKTVNTDLQIPTSGGRYSLKYQPKTDIPA
ncbi:hypothetical protein H5410_045506 [Solanum commersonii]|uniref:U3 small nucleolar RNA-associated protein 13 C-terminal domain-containing protein n=1 Tax=Solanum commersonii TaxID=4109 RepID=A0A9J5XDV1_SOLCO|nr:hypothetical protein H5410_045506 [Solanum commersonii]